MHLSKCLSGADFTPRSARYVRRLLDTHRARPVGHALGCTGDPELEARPLLLRAPQSREEKEAARGGA